MHLDDFWVLNFSNRSISIKDLSLIIRPNSMYNLLNKEFFDYTLNQLKQSLHFGSINYKKDRLIVSQIEPDFYDDCMVTACEEMIDQEDLDIYNEAI